MSVSVTRAIRDTQVMMLPCSGEVDLGDRIDGSTISQDFTARVGRGRGCKTVEMFFFFFKKSQYCFLVSMQRLFPVFPTTDGATVEVFLRSVKHLIVFCHICQSIRLSSLSVEDGGSAIVISELFFSRRV